MPAKYRECELCHSQVRIRREKALGRPPPPGLEERNALVARIAAERSLTIPEASHVVRIENLWVPHAHN
jgi:hypothetical protein